MNLGRWPVKPNEKRPYVGMGFFRRKEIKKEVEEVKMCADCGENPTPNKLSKYCWDCKRV